MNRSLPVEHQVDFSPCNFPRAKFTTNKITSIPADVISETIIPQGFRELIEYRCAQLGNLS